MAVLLTAGFTFIVQGITGREAAGLTRECLDYGSHIVAGVTPGRLGREVHGVPVFDTVEQAVEHAGSVPDGSVVTVPPAFTKDAVFESIEAGIGLIVIITERIPRRDVAEMVELAAQRGARIIGPNCLGLVAPGVAKMGGIGGPARNTEQAYQPGSVGVMSRSGGMTTEISSTLTAAGLGVSTAISIGGDAIIGSSYAELMPLFEADAGTEAIVIYTEPGGRMEAELARWVSDNDSRLPIVAFMAGRFMDDEGMKGMSFGHAGTIVEGAEDSATQKIARLEAAGIPVVERIDEIPAAVSSALRARGRSAPEAPKPREARLDLPAPASAVGVLRAPAPATAPGERRAGESQAAANGEAGGATAASRFVAIELAESVRSDAELAQQLAELCPVDIFTASGDGVGIAEENLDECILCGMCVDAAAPGGVKVLRLYGEGLTLER